MTAVPAVVVSESLVETGASFAPVIVTVTVAGAEFAVPSWATYWKLTTRASPASRPWSAASGATVKLPSALNVTPAGAGLTSA